MSLTQKNSPTTTQQSESTTVTKTDNRVAGANSIQGGNTDISGVSGNVRVTTTDQGAVAAGLQVALAALDSNNSLSQTAISSTAQTANSETQAAIDVASSVAQGQQNITIKYVMIGVVVVAVCWLAIKKGAL